MELDLATVRRDVHRFQVGRAQAQVAIHAGRAARSLVDDHREFPLAAAAESLALVRQEAASATGRRALRLRNLATAISTNLAKVTAGKATAAWQTRVPGPEAEVPLHSVLETLAHTESRTRRQALCVAVGESSEPLWSAWARQVEAARAGGLELPGAAAQARALLADTDDMYADVLAWWLSRATQLKPFPRGADAHDVLWALRSLPFDALARPGDVRSLSDAFRAAGLVGRHVVDADARAGRWPGAKVAVGDEVYVSHRARGGFHDAAVALRALGTALHRSGADPEAPPEDRLLGDPALPASTGELLAGLLLDAGWMKRRFDVDDPDRLRVLALADLAAARLDAALVLVTGEAFERGVSQALRDDAVERLSTALLGRWQPRELPLVLPDPFDAPTSLGARRLAASVREFVLERCNEDWWANPRTGAVLSELFRPGGLFTPDELSAQAGLPAFPGWAALWSRQLG